MPTPVGVDLLRHALGQTQSAIAAVLAELEFATPERWPGTLARTLSLVAIARDAAAIAAESLHAVAGAAPPIPDLQLARSPEGSARHRRAESEPDTEPAWEPSR